MSDIVGELPPLNVSTVVAIDEALAGKTLAAVVRSAMGEIPWTRAQALCRDGRVRVDNKVVTDPAARLRSGVSVTIDPTGPRLRHSLGTGVVVHVDRDVVVVNKPPGLMTVRFEKTDRDTLVDQVHVLLRRLPKMELAPKTSLGVVHRLDKDTTGLLVFARNLVAKKHLELQFRRHTVHRRYVAIVHGRGRDATHHTTIVKDRGDRLRGSWGRFRRAPGKAPDSAQHAVTHVRVLEELRGATLVECRLETGRQHQIRIHLSEAGTPLVGEEVYIRDFRGGQIAAGRPMLHATELGFVHPRTGRMVSFTQPPPEDFVTLLTTLRPRS